MIEELEHIGNRRGQEVRDGQDGRLGKLEEVYFDPHTGRPAYACVKSGLLGRRLSFVSLAGATLGEGYVRIAHTQAQVKRAPSLRPELQLTGGQARQLGEHYATPSPMDVLPGAGPTFETATLAPVSGAELLTRLDALERRVQELQKTLG
jgi:hypothetical protein